MKKFTLLLVLSIIISAFTMQAQVAIDNDGSDANTNAILHVKSGSTGAINSLFIHKTSGFIGIRTLNPSWMFHMTNGGVSFSSNSTMGLFENKDDNAVSLSIWNTSTSNPYASLEAATYYLEESDMVPAVKGIGFSNSSSINAVTIGVYGVTNEWQGYGVYGVRVNTGGNDSGFGGLFLSDLGYSGTFYQLSDIELKKDISSINSGIEIIKRLNPVSFYFDIDKYPYLGLKKEVSYGFIAQELELVIPSIVKEKVLPVNGTSEQKKYSNNQAELKPFKMVDYISLIPIAIEAIKEQQKIIEKLEQKVADLESKVNNQ